MFLDNIITTNGDLSRAAELAGYAGNHHQVLKSLKEEVIECVVCGVETDEYVASMNPSEGMCIKCAAVILIVCCTVGLGVIIWAFGAWVLRKISGE